MATKRKLKLLYDCSVCPAYCCTYQEIDVTHTDMRRIANHYGLTLEAAIKRFCKQADDKLVLRHHYDPIFSTACCFLNTETRRCTMYEDRPRVCRIYPQERRCGYYDFLMWERRRQDDPACIP